MAQAHDRIGMVCASACVVHCGAAVGLMLAGGSLLAGHWMEVAHDWLMPIGILMVALGIAPALWRHRSMPVALITIAGLFLWGLAMLDPAHGSTATVLEVAGAGCLVAAHWLNMKAARRALSTAVCMQGSKRAAGIAEAG